MKRNMKVNMLDRYIDILHRLKVACDIKVISNLVLCYFSDKNDN